MPDAISNTSPLLYLHRIDGIWGTLRILLEAKSQGLVQSIKPLLNHLEGSGMWISEEIRQRILGLAGEKD